MRMRTSRDQIKESISCLIAHDVGSSYHMRAGRIPDKGPEDADKLDAKIELIRALDPETATREQVEEIMVELRQTEGWHLVECSECSSGSERAMMFDYDDDCVILCVACLSKAANELRK